MNSSDAIIGGPTDVAIRRLKTAVSAVALPFDCRGVFGAPFGNSGSAQAASDATGWGLVPV